MLIPVAQTFRSALLLGAGLKSTIGGCASGAHDPALQFLSFSEVSGIKY
jgi:hypothetical protein